MSIGKPLVGVLVLSGAVLLVSSPAAGQSLQERIAQVRKQQAAEKARKRLGSDRIRILQQLLYTDLTVDFDAVPARDVFDYMKTAMDVNVVVRYADDPIGHGIDPQQEISLAVESMPALDVLDLVLEQCAVIEPCTWQLRSSYLEIGTKERLSAPAARFTKVYPVQDLLYRAPRFDDAPPLGMVPALPYYNGGGYFYGGYGASAGSLSGGFGSGGRTTGSVGSGTYGGGSMGGGSGYGTSDPNAVNSPEQLGERGSELVELIIGSVEPEAWSQLGGDWATIQYIDGDLVVNAPDYIHRQIGGYPRVPPPPAAKPAPKPAAKPSN